MRIREATDSEGTTSRSGGKFLLATPETRSHDSDGNLTSDGRFIYTWDAESRLVAMETHPAVPLPARRKLAFAYDAESRRIQKTVWHGKPDGTWQLRHSIQFIHEPNGWNLLAECSSSNPSTFLRTYTWGMDLVGQGGSPGRDFQGAGGVGGLLFSTLHPSQITFAYGMDLNGNVTLLIDTATQHPAATYETGPFGEPLRQSGEHALLNPYRFSTKYHDDETGLLDYGYRYYDPNTGRWPSRDPIEEEGGINLYGFVRNDGVNQWDYLGMCITGNIEVISFNLTTNTFLNSYRIQDPGSIIKNFLIARAKKKVNEAASKKSILYNRLSNLVGKTKALAGTLNLLAEVYSTAGLSIQDIDMSVKFTCCECKNGSLKNVKKTAFSKVGVMISLWDKQAAFRLPAYYVNTMESAAQDMLSQCTAN